MGRKPKVDEGLATMLTNMLQAVLPESAKQLWRDGTDGTRTFMTTYRSTSMTFDPTDWDGLEANKDVLGALVPHVCDKEVEQGTAAMAVRTLVTRFGLEADEKSIQQQAYQLRAMFSHLRRMIYKSRKGDENVRREKILPLALKMKPVRASASKAKKGAQDVVKKEGPKKEIKVEVQVAVKLEQGNAASGLRVGASQSSTRTPRKGAPQKRYSSRRPASMRLFEAAVSPRPAISTTKRRTSADVCM